MYDNNVYSRQIKVIGEIGQILITEAKIYVINNCPEAYCDIEKNLNSIGIKEIKLISANVKERDIYNNVISEYNDYECFLLLNYRSKEVECFLKHMNKSLIILRINGSFGYVKIYKKEHIITGSINGKRMKKLENIETLLTLKSSKKELKKLSRLYNNDLNITSIINIPSNEESGDITNDENHFVGVYLLLKKMENNFNINDNIDNHLCEYVDKNLNITTCFFGGLIATEVIKLVSHRFIPIKSTLIFSILGNNYFKMIKG